MRENYPLLVFDWDGTLADTTDHIANSLIGACTDLGLPVPSKNEAKYVIGLGLKDALQYLLPKVPEKKYGAIVEKYRIHYQMINTKNSLYPHVREGLKELKEVGFTLAIATGKSRSGLDAALETAGLEDFFSVTRCADEDKPKPNPKMLKWIMKTTGFNEQSTLMIGDTTHDLLMANKADTAGLAVSYGAHSKDALLQLFPVACIDNSEELFKWIRKNA